MAITISTLTHENAATSTIIAGSREYRKYTVTGAELTNTGNGIKLVSGGISVDQDWHPTDSSQGFFYVRETDGVNTLPLTSGNHTVSLVIYDQAGDGNSIPVTLTRANTDVIDVVAASAQLTAPSVFEKFVNQGATIADGQQLQFQNLDDSGDSVSYAASGIGTFSTLGRSIHRVCLWSSGTLYQEYIEVDNAGNGGKPNHSMTFTAQGSTPIYDGRSPSSARPAADRPYGANLWNINELTYVGACKIPKNTYNDGSIQFNQHQYFHYDNARSSIFIAGSRVSVQEGSLMVGEFSLPTLSTSLDFNALPVAANAQPFRDVFAGCTEGNAANLDRITGIYSNGTDSELIVNAIIWYDSAGPVSETTVCVNDKTNIAASSIDGLYDLGGGRMSSGWIGAIPAADQAAFGSTHYNGYAANDSIDSSLSIGPSVFGLNLADITTNPATNGVIAQTGTFMSFPYASDSSTHIMGADHGGVPNAIYNKTTTIRTLFFIPGTDTVMCVGKNDGLWWGQQYKVINDAGEVTNGNSPNMKRDRRNYYWLFNKNDLIDAKNGVIQPHQIQPYDFGVLEVPFQEVSDARYVPDGYSEIQGASFDPVSNRLYMILHRSGPSNDGEVDRPLICYQVI